MPPKNQKHAPGNTYTFKVASDTYAFARLAFAIPKAIYLVEIFDYRSLTPDATEEALNSPILIPYECIYPQVVIGRPWGWKLVSTMPDFKPPDREALENLELVTGICEVSRFDPDWVENCGRMLWKSKRRVPEEEYRRLDNSPVSMNRALNPQCLVADLRRRWGLHPFEWPNTRSMIAHLIEEGVYTPG